MRIAANIKSRLHTAPRTVVGYHGCSRESAERIFVDGRFLPSTNEYDWLGEGVYFWEYAPFRALEWAIEQSERFGGEPVVIQATIELGRCLNLLDTQHIPEIRQTYNY